jgi:hypothetical protein
MDPFKLRLNRRPDRCDVHGCRSHPAPGRRFCRRCREARYRLFHPYTYSLNKLRNNARRRGHDFDLTLEEWVMFCDLTGYVDARGRGADNLSVDRIDPAQGYTLHNIRAITVAQNSRQAAVDRKLARLRAAAMTRLDAAARYAA